MAVRHCNAWNGKPAAAGPRYVGRPRIPGPRGDGRTPWVIERKLREARVGTDGLPSNSSVSRRSGFQREEVATRERPPHSPSPTATMSIVLLSGSPAGRAAAPQAQREPATMSKLEAIGFIVIPSQWSQVTCPTVWGRWVILETAGGD